MTSETDKAIETVWRMESARLIGGLVRLVRDLDSAEELAHDALVIALEQWPVSGVPDNPGAWLMTTAKNRARNDLRRRQMIERKHQLLADEPVEPSSPESDADDVGDDVLRLIFITAHPVLSPEARVALTLRLVAGLTTAEIARAFLVAEPTIGQRIVRAKKTLSVARVPFEVPRGAELTERLSSVLEVIYLIFNEGYAATRGEDWIRPALTEEATRLGRVLTRLVPDQAEAHGLLALMEITGSRNRARIGRDGAPILLLDQDRSRWDQLLIRRGLAALETAVDLRRPLGPYALQAQIAACHARARRAEDTDWEAIVSLYDALVELTGSPVVELNRAVAVAMAFGPGAGLELTDELAAEPALRAYHLLPTVRADLLAKLGRFDEARSELLRAAALAPSERERELLEARARDLETKSTRN